MNSFFNTGVKYQRSHFCFSAKSAGFAGLAARSSRPCPSSPARSEMENRYQARPLRPTIQPPAMRMGRSGGVLRQPDPLLLPATNGL